MQITMVYDRPEVIDIPDLLAHRLSLAPWARLGADRQTVSGNFPQAAARRKPR